ncbi:MAG: YraN family protein [Nitrospirae bacterium]|nr:YraN family protein [Nitrospirota bacterium]
MKAIGIEGENAAVKFLEENGYRIIRRNYNTYIGEIDIIAQDGETTVFVEVKTRGNESFGKPFEAVNKRKKQKLKNLALLYMKKQGKEIPIRFDILSIFSNNNGNKEIEHIKDAFEI